jgi:histone H3/H4
MGDDQDLFEESKKSLTVEPNSETESDDILELTDVVREGKDPLQLDADAPLLLDEEKPDPHQEDVTQDAATEDLFSEMSKKPDIESGIDEPASENDLSPLESSDFKFEDTTPLDVDAEEAEPFPEQSQTQLEDVLAGIEQQTEFEKPEDILAELEKETPESETPELEQAEDFPSGYEEPDESEKPLDVDTPFVEKEAEIEETEEVAATHEVPGMSAEEMKTVLTEITHEALEPAVRETVSEVTEKIIPETVEKAVQETVGEIAERTIQETVERAVQDTVSEVAEKVVRETVSEVAEKIIRETVDKAVRETVSDVAERVIGEAIDALKESIASSEL